jgi:hypothetical protein
LAFVAHARLKPTNCPRELIHLRSEAREKQLQRWELGSTEGEADELSDRAALKDALPEVSRVRLEQTLYAEYPALRDKIQQLDGAKTEQTPESLAKVWGVPADEAAGTASALGEIGFFEKRGTRDAPSYWVPFLYRDALKLIQGSADPERQGSASLLGLDVESE